MEAATAPSSSAGADGTASSAGKLGRETKGGGVSSRRGEVDCEEEAVEDAEGDAAEEGRLVEAAVVMEGEEQRESSASDSEGVEVSEVKEE